MKIYLVQQIDTQLYKIGVTKKEIEVRIKELQVGNPCKIILVDSFATNWGFKLENYLHKTYRGKKELGEWFTLNEDEVRDFLSNCIKGEKAFDVLKKYDNPFL